MNKKNIFIIITLIAVVITGCGCEQNTQGNVNSDIASNNTSQIEVANNEANNTENNVGNMKVTINDTEVNVSWEQNEAVGALRQIVSNSPLTIQMSMYEDFEQVGSIGQNLPRNDVQTTASTGDIMLYSGNKMVVFYGSNSWAYTRLGKITDKSAAELKELLGNGNVTITITSAGSGVDYGTILER